MSPEQDEGKPARRKRARVFSEAVTRIPRLTTLAVPRAYFLRPDDIVMNAARNPSVLRIYSKSCMNKVYCLDTHLLLLQSDTRLREIVYLPWYETQYTTVMYTRVSDESERACPHTRYTVSWDGVRRVLEADKCISCRY